MRRAVQKPDGALSPDDLRSITDLRAENQGITDLGGLEQLVNLRYLWLSGNKISDLGP